MKTYVETKRPFRRNCNHCGRKLEPGQWLLEQAVSDQVGLDTKVRVPFHVKCIRSLLQDVPHEGLEAFEELRQKMAMSGKVFPS